MITNNFFYRFGLGDDLDAITTAVVGDFADDFDTERLGGLILAEINAAVADLGVSVTASGVAYRDADRTVFDEEIREALEGVLDDQDALLDAAAHAPRTVQESARDLLRQELEEIAAQGWADLAVWTDEAEIPGPCPPGERGAGDDYVVGLWRDDEGDVRPMCRWYRAGVAWWPDEEGDEANPDAYQAEGEPDNDTDQYGDVSTRCVVVDADTARRAEAVIRARLVEVEQEGADDPLGRYRGLSTATIILTTTASEEADQ